MKKYFAFRVHEPNTNDSDDQLFYAVEEVDARIEKMEEALQRIVQWADAYPLDVFPEPDFKKVNEVLQAADLSLDQVSASNMRHVITQVGKMASAALGKGESP